MSLILLQSMSTGISYPYLYFQLAASYLALCTVDLLSATIPVITQPIVSVN